MYCIDGCFVNFENKICLVHIYKNASITFRNTFDLRGKYYKYADVKDKDLIKVAIIRHPLKRIVSIFLYMLGDHDYGFKDQHDPDKIKLLSFYKEEDVTKQFTMFIDELKNGFFSAVALPQTEFLKHRKINLEDLDYIFIQESMDTDFDEFNKKYKLNGYTLTKDNTGDDDLKIKLENFLKTNSELKNDIEQLYKGDYDLYNKAGILKNAQKHIDVICTWGLKRLNISSKNPIKLWIDITHLPPKDGNTHIYYLREPPTIRNDTRRWILKNHNHYKLILTYDENILSKCSNAIPYHQTETWITLNEVSLLKEKEFNVSFICGGKLMCVGHKLRQEVWYKQKQITMPKKMFYSRHRGSLRLFNGSLSLGESKFPAFVNSMFHIIVENTTAKGCFTEKIVDSLVTKTVPIYYGCPDIGDFFHIEGIIVASSAEDIINICNKLTPLDYHSRNEWIEKNQKIVLEKYPCGVDKSFNIRLNPIIKKYDL